MMRFGEILSFSGIALGLHLGAWAWMSSSDQIGDVAGGGDAGDGPVSVIAASGEIADLVEAWTSPTEVMTTAPDHPVLPPTAGMSADVETAALTPENIAPPPPLDTAIESAPEQMPEVDATAAALIAMPEPQAESPPAPRPKARPKDLNITKAAPKPKSAPKPAPKPATQKQPKKQPKKAAPKAAQPKAQAVAKGGGQKAAGQANGTTGGKNSAGTAKLSKAAEQSLIGKWGGGIRRAIERKKQYPRGGRANGTVKLRVTVAPQGRLIGVKVLASSGDAALDQAAVRAVQKARLPKAPKGLTKASYPFNLPISFKRR